MIVWELSININNLILIINNLGLYNKVLFTLLLILLLLILIKYGVISKPLNQNESQY